MQTKKFLVLNRGNRRVIRQCGSLAEATGYSDGHSQPTSIAALIQSRASIESEFVIQTVHSETGKVIATSPAMGLGDALEELCNAKLLLVPAELAVGKAVRP